MDSQNLFEENMPLEPVEAFMRAHREDMPEITFMHVLMAAMVRMIAEKPYLNRFVVWNKIYARNSISISLMIKRKGSNVETMIKPEFQPEDTLRDVMEKVSALVNVNILEDAKNGMDAIARFFGYILLGSCVLPSGWSSGWIASAGCPRPSIRPVPFIAAHSLPTWVPWALVPFTTTCMSSVLVPCF